MANDPSTSQATNPSAPIPELVGTLSNFVERLAALEGQLDNPSAMETSINEPDSYITERNPDSEFSSYPEFLEALRSIKKDLFRNPLPKTERRRFLSECPRNIDRNYQPPPINSINVGQATKRYDAELSDVQFRLSGITRPLDFFLHRVVRNGSVTTQETIEFINVMHSYWWTPSPISHNYLPTTCSRLQAFKHRLLAYSTARPPHAPLLDPTIMLDHVNLSKSVTQAGRAYKRFQRGKAYSSNNHTKSENEKSDSNTYALPTKSNNNNFPKKGVHSGPNSQDKGKHHENSQ